MKKSVFIISGLVLLFAASCNRKSFEKKLVGEWGLHKYLYAGVDESRKRVDTTMNAYKLTISEGQTWSEFWQSLVFVADTVIKADTLSYDDVSMTYNIKFDTIPVVDTFATPHFNTGRWDLLNSEADIQLKDSLNTIRVYRILTLDPSTLNLRNGNEEMYLKK